MRKPSPTKEQKSGDAQKQLNAILQAIFRHPEARAIDALEIALDTVHFNEILAQQKAA